MKAAPSFLSAIALSAGIAHADLAATFTSGDLTDTRADRLPALLTNAGDSPTPFLPAGEFGVTWSGKLVLTDRQRLVFSFEGEGKATLTIDGKELLTEEGILGTAESKSTRLNRGEHDISIKYNSKADGSGRFRLFWTERSFPKQSVPPTVFQTEVPTDPARVGRLLFAENHCSKCHVGSVSMPELTEYAPLLMASGSRLNEDWMAHWIADPASLRPETRMPALVDASTAEGKQKAADLAAWLAAQKLGEVPAAPDKELAQTGGEHFHRLGCAACHTLPGAEHAAGRLSLDNVAYKFQPGALAGFLKKPETWYAHIGMPNFGLSDSEAEEIAAFVLDASGKVENKREKFPKGDATRGAALANELNCGACHAGSGMLDTTLPPLQAIFEKDWSASGCVSGVHGGKVPKLALTDDERAALVAFSKKGPDSLSRHVPIESTAARIKALRCTSCHSLDGVQSLLDSVHLDSKDLVAHVEGENEKLDQSRPQLTYIGEMLHSSYIESVINGTPTGGRPRPWLDMRMPAFPSFANSLATGFAHTHGVVPGKAEPATPDADLALIGKSLISSDGFGCTTCHGVGSMKPTAAFEVEGINFSLAHERLRHEWYIRWMDNPGSVTPGSKMPRYSERGKSQRSEFGGDATKQFDAIWNYIQKPD